LSLSQNGLFTQTLRYAQNFFLGILPICLRQNFSHALILSENPHFARGSINKDISAAATGISILVWVVVLAVELTNFWNVFKS
jgi:hypothetical protein